MPFARIDLVQGKSDEYRQALADVVYGAIVEVLKAPKDDRFQVILEHAPENHIADENYLGIKPDQGLRFHSADAECGPHG